MKKIAIVIASLALWIAPALAQTYLPPDVHISLSDFGPVFTDSQGMTLYVNRRDTAPGKSECNDVRMTLATMGDTTFTYTVPDPAQRKTCVQKWPPLFASAGAQASGGWTLISRSDGRQQWAYEGHPLYRSVKDKAPGDVNGSLGGGGRGSFGLAIAPLEGAPSIVGVAETSAGLVLAALPKRLTLYMVDRDVAENAKCARDCNSPWMPLIAPAVSATTDRDWSFVARKDGSKQWAYKGSALYTHTADVEIGSAAGQGLKGSRIALLRPAPKIPAEVAEKVLPEGSHVYANRAGKSLYVFGCNEETPDVLSCDDPGDSAVYWMTPCGGPSHCPSVFRPLIAPEGARTLGNSWSVVRIDPDNPTKLITEGVPVQTVWAYRGKPVFTYAGDQTSDDANGQMRMFAISNFSVIPVYGDRDRN